MQHDAMHPVWLKLRQVVLIAVMLTLPVGGFATAAAQQTGQGDGATPAAAATPSAGTFEPSPCPYPVPPFLTEGDTISCGYLTVPQFHAQPDGPTLRLAVLTLRSTAAQPAPDPVVFLAGGPGQGAGTLLPAFDPSGPISLAPLLERGDVILFDQRGTGRSEPALTCPIDDQLAQAAAAAATPGAAPVATPDPLTFDIIGAYGDECRAALTDQGIDLEAFTTDENAADVETLRAALGYDQVNLFGTSYGSRLGLEVMRDHPTGVRSAILTSLLPAEADLIGGGVIAFDTALKLIFAQCAADPACASLNPDLPGDFERVVASLNAEPMVVQVQDPNGGGLVEVPVTGATFLATVYAATFIGSFLPVVPPLITQTAAGNPEVVSQVLPVTLILGQGIARGMYFATICQDEIPFSSPEQIQASIDAANVLPPLADGEYSGAGSATDTYEICARWGLEPTGPDANEPVVSDVPALVISGEFDPITPPSYGDMVAASLTSEWAIVLPGQAHDPTTTGGPCAMGIVLAYLNDPATMPDTSCAAALAADFSPEPEPAGTPAATPGATPLATPTS